MCIYYVRVKCKVYEIDSELSLIPVHFTFLGLRSLADEIYCPCDMHISMCMQSLRCTRAITNACALYCILGRCQMLFAIRVATSVA